MTYLGSPEAYKLFHEGSLVFNKMERNGFHVDVGYCEKQRKIIKHKMSMIEEEIGDTEEGRKWNKLFGRKTNYDADDQLSELLYDHLGFEPTRMTKTGKRSVDASVLEDIESPLITLVLRLRKLIKAEGTYLNSILREETDGILHTALNLHLVSSFRSSSSDPNLQNIPIRDPDIARLIRRAFKPRKGNKLVFADFAGNEVKVSACYHEDPKMIEYIENPETDMHRDMAQQCFLLDEDEVSKDIRYIGKNGFVFPEFYGSYYVNVAREIWNAMNRQKLKLPDGTYLSRHLKEEGIYSLADFTDHIQRVETDFWERRFKVYNQWKKDFHNEYLKKGYFTSLTGFMYQGVMTRNEVLNVPIQGSAFHLLVWACIEIDKEIEKRQMDTKLIMQIHDEVVADVPEEEFEEYCTIVKSVMEKRIQKAFPWLIVPAEVDIEHTDVDKSWFHKYKLVS